MGTTAHVVVCGGPADLAELAQRRIAELEARWSRFLPVSELSLLNAAPRGRPTVLSMDTYRLIDTAVRSWRETEGRYDPTVLAAMIEHGYARSFSTLPSDTSCRASLPRPTTGCAGIQLEPAIQSVVLPAGVGIDPGGIGKGLAADIVVEELLAHGARGALVDIGGDIRVEGEGPDGGAWIIDIEDPLDPERVLLHLALHGAGIATSSRLRRRWHQNGVEHHHLIDPGTGEPIITRIVAVSVIAAQAWWAEALTKAVLVAGDLTPVCGASAVIVDVHGRTVATPDLEELLS
jgi:thiamine biosynthesis lipoprotein